LITTQLFVPTFVWDDRKKKGKEPTRECERQVRESDVTLHPFHPSMLNEKEQATVVSRERSGVEERVKYEGSYAGK